MQNPQQLTEGLESIEKIIDYLWDDEEKSWEDNCDEYDPGDHIFTHLEKARDFHGELVEIFGQEVKAFGGEYTIGQILCEMNDEEKAVHFTQLAETLHQQGRLTTAEAGGE